MLTDFFFNMEARKSQVKYHVTRPNQGHFLNSTEVNRICSHLTPSLIKDYNILSYSGHQRTDTHVPLQLSPTQPSLPSTAKSPLYQISDLFRPFTNQQTNKTHRLISGMQSSHR